MSYIIREETINNIRFVCCDNMPFMEDIDMGYYHFGVADPPYGVDIGNERLGKSATQYHASEYTKEDWDKSRPKKEYFDQFRRVTRQQVIWGANYFFDFLPSTDCCIVWDKEQGDVSFDDFELAWTSFKTKSMVCKRNRAKDSKHDKIHQTQKPVYLYKWIFAKAIRYGYLKKGQRVLDTHGGSHNIAIAAYEYGLHLTILEIDMKYHLEGIANFKTYTMQGVLGYE